MPELKSRTVSIFRNGRSQAIRIPKEFEFDTEQAVITQSQDGLSLKLTPAKTEESLKDLMNEWLKKPAPDPDYEFPEIDHFPVPLDDIDLSNPRTAK